MNAHCCQEIITALNEKRIPCGKVLDYDELNNDPQLEARGMYRQVAHPRLGKIDVPGNPVRLVDTPGDNFDLPCPDLGQHTDEILKGILEKSEQEIAKLKDGKAVM